MHLLRAHQTEAEAQVKLAREQVQDAVSTLTDLLDKVEEQVTEAKEHLDERRTG